jgi:hypothetical protein
VREGGAERERGVWGKGRLTGGAQREKSAAVLTAARTARVGAGGGEGFSLLHCPISLQNTFHKSLNHKQENHGPA